MSPRILRKIEEERSSAKDGIGILRKIRGRLLPFLFLLYVVAYLDRINVGFAALQMKDQLGFSDAVYGLGAGIFFGGYFLFQVPSNLVLQRVGARRWIAFLMVLWGIISAAMLFVVSARSFYALRFLLGAAEAGFFPGVIFYLRSWFPASSRAGVLALFMTAGPISGVIGGPISGALLEWNHRGGLAGWQWMFLLEALPAIVLGLVAGMYLPDSPEKAHWLTASEKGWLGEELAREHLQPKKFRCRKGWELVEQSEAVGICGCLLWLELLHLRSELMAAERVEASEWLAEFAAGVFDRGAVFGCGDGDGAGGHALRPHARAALAYCAVRVFRRGGVTAWRAMRMAWP